MNADPMLAMSGLPGKYM